MTAVVPVVPGRIVSESHLPALRTLLEHQQQVLALNGASVDVYAVGSDGTLSTVRSLHLRRAGHDMAVFGKTLAVADGDGVSLYRLEDGVLLSSVGMCGLPRRVFADGRRVYVVGLLSVMVLDVSEPSAPAVLERIRLLPGPRGLAVRSCGDCGWFDRGFDRVCDWTGACGAFGRSAAAYDRGRLFLHLLGTLYVLDFRDGAGAVVAGAIPVGFATDLAVERPFVYANGPARRTAVVAEQPDGTWTRVGEHDVDRWVTGVTNVGEWSIHVERGRAQVATRQ